MHKYFKSIIFIVIDALRAKNMGCYGYPLNTTVHIDAFAKKCVRFTNCYTSCSNTDPSFTSIMSGLFPTSHGVINHANLVTDVEKEWVKRVKFLSEFLKEKGFKTYGLDFLGRWHKRGFNVYLGLSASEKKSLALRSINKLRDIFRIHPGSKIQRIIEKTPLYDLFLNLVFLRGSPYMKADSLTDKAIEILNKESDPTFMFIHYWDPHQPYDPPAEDLEAFSEVDYKKIYPEVNLSVRDIALGTCPPLTRFHLKCSTAGTHSVFAIAKKYDAEIRFVDRQIGRIIDYLELNNRLDETLLIITADHGESLFNHGVYFTHDALYNDIIRVPLLIYSSQLKPKIVDELVQNIDIMPTILDLLDIDPQEKLDGVSFLPTIQYGQKVRDIVYSLTNNRIKQEHCIIAQNGFKYINSPNIQGSMCQYCRKSHRPTEELFNLNSDPEEKFNLADSDDFSNIKRELLSKLQEFPFVRLAEQVGVFSRTLNPSYKRKVSEEEKVIQRRLEDLGYF
jgi:arylsulfatase A-like enzyme